VSRHDYERIPYLVAFQNNSGVRDVYGGLAELVVLECYLLRPDVESDTGAAGPATEDTGAAGPATEDTGAAGPATEDTGAARPATEDTVLVFMHPIGGGAYLPMVNALARAGHHVIYAGSRYRGTDSNLIMEKVVEDLGKVISDAKDRLGY
jgi:hypothetical protein